MIFTGNFNESLSFSAFAASTSKMTSSSQTTSFRSMASARTVPMAPQPINPTFFFILVTVKILI